MNNEESTMATAPPEEQTPARRARTTPGEPAEVLRGMADQLLEIRVMLDKASRAQQHRELSVARPIGAIVQAVVVGLLAWALSDWVFAVDAGQVLIKLGFAIALQLVALTAFTLMPRD